MTSLVLYTPLQHQEADQRATASGIAFEDLVASAGTAVASSVNVLARTQGKTHVLVVCGPGNNGADGLVAAQRLRELGYDVDAIVLALRDTDGADTVDGEGVSKVSPTGLAAMLAEIGDDDTANLLIVDAVFGAGLSRPLDTMVVGLVHAINAARMRGAAVVAVDVPSGLDGGSGQMQPVAPLADMTVTFTTKKPGHLLLPGRGVCGHVVVSDIGIASKYFDEPRLWENDPELWDLPVRRPGGHKYDAGHTLVVSGGRWNTGASRLAAQAALRIGSGAVTVTGDEEALAVHAAHLTEIMLAPLDDQPDDLATLVSQRRITTTIAGPALGLDPRARARLRALWDTDTSLVADADALTIIADDPTAWWGRPRTVLTPHEAEFARVFGDLDLASKVETTRAAARSSGAVVAHKGSDTVVAAPDGRAVINTNAPASLATAGSGDVLAGIIGGLLAQAMPPFEAACAGVWLHGQAARHGPQRLIATDLLVSLATMS